MFEIIAVIAMCRWAIKSTSDAGPESFGRALGRALNGGWLAVAVAVLSIAGSGVSEEFAVWPFLLVAIALIFVPAVTLFFCRAPQAACPRWLSYTALSGNVLAVVGLSCYATVVVLQGALSRGGAGAISAFYFSSWLALAAALNVVMAGLTTVSSRRPAAAADTGRC